MPTTTSFLNGTKRLAGVERTFLVHGEEEVMASFATKLASTQIEMPTQGQSFSL